MASVMQTTPRAISAPLDKVVVPSQMATNDQAFGSGTLANPQFRIQTVYTANQFPGEPILIKELRYRPDYYYGNAFSTTIANIQINLSTTSAMPEVLNSDFSANVGSDDKVVLEPGSLTISSEFRGPSEGPKAFDIVIHLDKPFYYNRLAGNLLVDVRNYSGSSASLLSGAGIDGDGASRVSGSLSSPTGVADDGADAMEIGYQTLSSVIVPHETNSFAFGSGTLANSDFRIQEVYASTLFPTNSIRIRAIRFQPDWYYGNPFSTTIEDFQVNMSTTKAAPDVLSSTFARNVGTDDVKVLDGSVDISSAFTGPMYGPKDNDIVIPLTKAYTYNPANGNLLIDIRNSSGSGASLLGGSPIYGDGASRVGGSLSSPTGVADSGADEIELDYTPE